MTLIVMILKNEIVFFFFRCGVCVRLWVDPKELVKFWFKHDSAWKPMG